MTTFLEAINGHGLTPPAAIEPGRLHRFPGAGKVNGNQAGWAMLFPDEQGGVFGDWSSGLSETWQAERDRPLTKAEREAFRRQCEEAKAKAAAERARQHEEAARRAARIWEGAARAPAGHFYLVTKGVKPYGLRVHDGCLVIPLRDVQGRLWSLQFIDPDGAKRFLSCGRKAGCYFSMGRPSGVLCICEGYATGSSIHEATGHAVAVAFDAGNLLPVAQALREKFPGIQLIVCADNDIKGDNHMNIGVEAATTAARAVGSFVAVPELDGQKVDFNNLHQTKGLEAVRACIEHAAALAVTANQEQGEAWPEPSPLTTHHQAAPYPLDALPGCIGAAVREVVDVVQCPVPLAACSALSAVSTVAQGLVDVRRAEKLEGPSSLFLLAIADSGERKTTVDGHFSKPIQEWEAQQLEAAKSDLKKYEAEKDSWEAKKTGLLAAIKNSAKTGKNTADLERKLAELEDTKPEPPKIPRLLHEDTTPEALAFRLAKGWPVGGVLSSEAATVLGGHAMGKDSAMRNMGLLNKLWEGGRVRVDRKTSESFVVQGARLTMGLAVQPETVHAFLESSKGLARGIGFLARFLVAWPESTQGNRMFKDPPATWPHLEKFYRRLGLLLDHPLSFNACGELEPTTLDLSPEAKAVWVAFSNDVEVELRPGREMAEVRDVASKAADNAARLAALFHLFEHGLSGVIGPEHIKAAASIAGWHLYEARRFMGEIALPVEVSNAAKLEDWLLENSRQKQAAEVSTRDIQRLGPNCTREKHHLDAALVELADAGRVRVAKDGQRKVVRINPALLSDSHGIA